jgi:hypothetical protein
MTETAATGESPQRRQTEVRRFLRRLCLFVTPVVVALGALEARMSTIPNAYSRKLAMVDERRDAIEALVLGSSHEFEGVDTDAFSRPTFNLAMPSQSVSQSSEVALQYLRVHRIPGQSAAVLALPKLRSVLLGISYYSLPYRMSTTGDDRLGFYMRTYRVFGDTTLHDLVNPSNYLYMGIYGWPAVQGVIRQQTEDYVGNLGPGGSNRGSHGPPADAARPTFEATAIPRAAYHHEVARSSNVAVNLDFMRRLAAECRLRGVRLMLFTSPVTEEYADAFGADPWLVQRQIIERFSSEFAVDYFDYSRSAAFTWRDFANADHLNGDGAARFGRLLSSVVFPD